MKNEKQEDGGKHHRAKTEADKRAEAAFNRETQPGNILKSPSGEFDVTTSTDTRFPAVVAHVPPPYSRLPSLCPPPLGGNDVRPSISQPEASDDVDSVACEFCSASDMGLRLHAPLQV